MENLNQEMENLNQEIYSSFNFSSLTKTNILEIPMGPGIYIIICKKNKKIYFGESIRIVSRLEMHYRSLEEKTHDCHELHEDYNCYGKGEFLFAYLSIGPQWVDPKTRIKEQNKLINLNVDSVYNDVKLLNTLPKFKRKVKFKGQTYPSIAEASRKTGVSETHIGRL